MIRILAVGKLKDKRLAALIGDFVKRCRPLARVEITEIKDSRMDREGRDLLSRLDQTAGSAPVIALDEHGDDLTSVEFSKLLGTHGSLSFLIGGADGLDPAVKQRADRLVRLSSMTLTHEMARLLLTEQIYRGLAILRGLPYHRP